MSDPSTPIPRPVSLVAIVALFVLLSLFGVVTVRVYTHHRPAAPQNEAPENLTKDLQWKATPESRKAALLELRKKQAEQAASYAWVDQSKGIVQLPVDRAMELIVEEHGAK
jgi:hypothetical protein